MAFWGHSFTFDGRPCEDYDLMMYDIGGNSQDEANFASSGNIIEDVVGVRWRPYFYGVQFENKLEFEITFGVNMDRLDHKEHLSRSEISEIASWLTGHTQYKWLEIEQEDLEYIRYKCMITDLSIVSYGNIPYTFRAKITCDSPYAYKREQEYQYNITGTTQMSIYNESCLNVPYYPIVVFEPSIDSIQEASSIGDLSSHSIGEMKHIRIGSLASGQGEAISFSIKNNTDSGRTFQIDNMPGSISSVLIDNDHGIISNNMDLNIYPMCNFRFFRLIKGMNELEVTGNGILRIICEYPVNPCA